MQRSEEKERLTSRYKPWLYSKTWISVMTELTSIVPYYYYYYYTTFIILVT
jgi:hypothetical protein